MNVPDFKNMNEYSGLLKNEYLFGMNTLDFYKMKFFWHLYFGFGFGEKWLSPNVSNLSEIFQGSLAFQSIFGGLL